MVFVDGTRLGLPLAPALLAAAVIAGAPAPAEACGGTFCDAGQPMAVDQEGENILFVYEPGAIEVHIQIQYTGDPAKFGWVIPLQSTPDLLAAGSEALFQNMLNATVPQYGFTTTRDTCTSAGTEGMGFPGGALTGGGTGGGDDGGSTGAFDEDPEILIMEEVGAFEITVLTADNAQTVVDWLDENEYLQDDESTPIIDQYLSEGHVLAAVKLTDGASLGEIHPIVFRFASDEPCVPLRLTRIAAVDDMEIRSFFLGEARTVPRTYRHVLVNPLKIDWPLFAQNYKEAITLAVDAESADGRAFVTEFAGESNIVPQIGIYNDAWNAAAFESLAAADVVDTLELQGLWGCGGFDGTCGFQHPLLLPLMQQYLPTPAGVTEADFYDCLSCYEEMIDPDAWDAAAFANDLEERIFAPGRRAVAALDSHPYLTRMYTTISPGEMTEDPMFWQNPDLEDVANVNQAQQRILCNGDQIWTLPDGREVYVKAGEPWPDFDNVDGGTENEPPQMPFAERIAEVPEQGAPMNLVDNAEVIDAKLRAYNLSQGWNGQPIDEGSDPSQGVPSGGCGCRLDERGAMGLWLLMLGAGLTVRRRR